MSAVIGMLHREEVRLKAIVITVLVAAISFPLTFVLWPPTIPSSASGAAQILGLGLLAAECLALGGGVAFLVLGYGAVGRPTTSRPLAIATYLGVGFYLVNWWAHDHLHAVASTLDFNSWLWMTVVLEYAFHAGMAIVGAVLALVFAKLLRESISGTGVRGRVSKLGFRWRIATITAAIAMVSIPLSLLVFHPVLPGGRSMPVAVIPFFLGMKIVEGLALGAGICFVLLGWRLLRRTGESRALTVLAYLSISWYLVNWWLHDNLHAVNGQNLSGLLAIEYAFHFTLMVAAGVLAVFFYRVAAENGLSRGVSGSSEV